MAKKAETLFKERVARDLKSLNCTFFVKIQQVTLRGTPDFLVCINGRFIALELKRSRLAPVAPLQQFTLEKIVQAKGEAFLVYPENWEGTFLELKKLSESEVELIPIDLH